MRLSRLSIIPLVMLGMAVAGCGKKSASESGVSASGSVTYKNQPLAKATVTFLIDGKPKVTTTDDQGNFTINNLPVGEARVAVTKYADAATTGANMEPGKENTSAKGPEYMMGGSKNEVPERYSNPSTSGLKANVTANEADNKFKFDLKEK